MLLLLLILAAGAIYVVLSRYNALQTLAQEVREAHANVMASMKKRIDLTNKLIDIAKGYADHEKLTHISVAGAGDEISVGGAGTAAAGALNQVLKLATQYPDLKANTAFQQLMTQLDQIEADLQDRRERYNNRVKLYNTALVKLPVSLYARQLGFHTAPYFDVDNADSLDKLKDFHSDDADHLKDILAHGTRKLADGSRRLAGESARLAGESVRLGKLAVEKGIEKGVELHQQHAAGSATPGFAAESAAAAPAASPAPGTRNYAEPDRKSAD
jgi:LemA protein